METTHSHRTSRRLLNINSQEFVIKAGFDKSFKCNFNYKNSLKNIVFKRVVHTSKAAHRLGILYNIILKKCFKTNPLKIILPENIFNDSFAYQLITDTNSLNSLITDELTTRSIGDTNSLVTVASTYITSLKTYLQENFKRKQLAFLNVWCELNGGDIKVIRYTINGWETKTPYVFTEKELRLINFHRKILKLDNKNLISKQWINKNDDSNYKNIIIYFNVLSRYLVKKHHKSILVAPLPKIKTSYMYIDSNVFYGILKECKYPINSTSVIKFRDEYSEKCNEIFNPNKLLTKNQIDQGFKFTGTMKTDGVAINFHFRRPKLIYSTKEIDRNDPNIRVIGQDPGRTKLFCGVEELRDGTFKKYSLSRGQFYTDTGIKKATQKSNKWNVKYLGVILDELSQTNSRSNSYNDFLCYVSVIKKYYIKLWEEGSKKRHSRQRFKIYSSKKSVYDKFFQSFKNKNDQREIVIAYGDSGFASTAKYGF
jgi:hypothetical protein